MWFISTCPQTLISNKSKKTFHRSLTLKSGRQSQIETLYRITGLQYSEVKIIQDSTVYNNQNVERWK